MTTINVKWAIYFHSFIHSFILNQATWPIDSSNTIKSETD